jgi:hypothetical protein
MTCPEVPQPGRQPACSDYWTETQGHDIAFTARFNLVYGVVYVVKSFAQRIKQLISLVSQLNPSHLTLEQHETQLCLKGFDLMTDRGCGNAQFLRRVLETQVPRSRFKGF